MRVSRSAMNLVRWARSCRVRLLRFAGLCSTVAVAVFLAAPLTVSSDGTGFDNGFEGGQLGGWDPVNEAEPIVIVGAATEGRDDFDIYAELGIDVVPNLGEFMLRLGEPKTQNETQARGLNTISQHFVADGEQIALALRLFSLDHRGDDALRFYLRDADGNDVPSATDFDFGNGTVCGAPCSELIDVGKRKEVIATAWQELRFSGLQPGASYTITIELEAGQNESLASWLYVDGVNLAPSAEINVGLNAAVEGDFVAFDCSASADPEGSDLTCIWNVGGAELIGRTVAYHFPDNGTYPVHLEVSDGEESAKASTSITVRDQVPLVNAIDVEVVSGGTVDLVCRYVDPGLGADDQHTIVFSVGDDVYEQVHESVAALSSGYARARYTASEPAGTSIGGSCSAGLGGDNFTISVVSPEQAATEALANTGSTLRDTQTIRTDLSSLGALANPDSVAVYEILGRDGLPPPAGAEVLVTAHVPVDYDIAVLSKGPEDGVGAPWASAPFVSVPFVSVPFVSVPFVSVPFVSVPFVSVPFVSAPFVSVPFVSVPFVSAPFVSVPFVSVPFVSVGGTPTNVSQSIWDTTTFSLENFMLSQLAGAPDGSNVSGVDISINDLGAQNLGSLFDEAVFVKGISAEFGTNREQVLVEVAPGERGLYVAVIPQAGSFSSAPFSLEVEASIPLPQTDWLSACDPVNNGPLVTASAAVNLPAHGSETLIVTQAERIMATFGMTAAEWNAWMESLDPFLQMVGATVISVPSAHYDDADTNPCVVEKQNAVAEAVKAEIDAFRAAHPGVKYVQLLGSLDIVPPYYVPDQTLTGNEALFASDLLAKPGSPLSVAIAEGYMLTDAFYVDSEPQPFSGRSLYVEDISVSRLVETPEEILARAQRFVASGGKINLTSVEASQEGVGTQSTGYDFFVDGTEEINRILTRNTPYAAAGNVTRNDQNWSADELRCQFFGEGEGCTKPVSAVNAVNAHMSYNAGLSARGFNCAYAPGLPGFDSSLCANVSPLGEAFLATESAGIYDEPEGSAFPNVNGVTFSIGCHSGLSVPGAWGLSEELGFPIDPARDWVQQLGTWVGSYNFAYGDTDVADRGTEGIMPLVIENFGKGMTLGEALVMAKWQYGAGLFEFGVYDEKSMVGLNLFGMPQATLEGAGQTDMTMALASVGSAAGTGAGADLVVNVIDGDSETQAGGAIIEEPAPGSTDTGSGIWYSIDGNAQAIFGRPLLPVLKPFELQAPPAGSAPIHGVALRGGAFEVILDRDPVFPSQKHDLIQSIAEPQPCVETLSPSLIASATRFESPGGPLQSLIVQSGQFRCTNAPQATPVPDGYEVRGDFRIWKHLDLELMRPLEGGVCGGPNGTALDCDLRPPEVLRQDLVGNPETGIVTATLDATDSSGIREIIALVYADDDGQPGGTGTATPYSVTERSATGVYELVLPDAFDKLLSFQYIDTAGNISAKTLKGALLRAIDVVIRTSIVNLVGSTQIVVEISDFGSLIAPYLTINFGDGTTARFELSDSNPDGYRLETFPDPDGEGIIARVIIDKEYNLPEADEVTISVDVRASGAQGSDEKTIFGCSDPLGDADRDASDIVGCSIMTNGTAVSIGMYMAGSLASDVQYRLVLPQTNTQLKYSDGSLTGPKKIGPIGGALGDNGVMFNFDARKLGWDGVSEFQFKLETQDGVAGGQGQGFVDETTVKTYLP